MKKIIPYGMHEIDDKDIQSVLEVLRSGSITQGTLVEDFGNLIAEFSSAKYGVAVSSGTAALHLSVAALDIKPGDEVITTPMTFCATANVILYQGGTVKFVDIDQNTLNIDPELIEKKITDKTVAIIPVDFRGHPANLPKIKKIADKYNLKIITDGSHSIGSSYFDNGLEYFCGNGKHSDLYTFSFHPVKHITTGEGGAILTDDEKLYKKINLLRKHGIDRREEMFSEKKRIGDWIYDMEFLGYNYRITDFQSALGISQLKKINLFKIRRREIVSYYNDHLKDIDRLILPYESRNVNSNFHIYTIQVKKNKNFDRYDLYNYLVKNNIRVMVHYIPVHLLSYFKNQFGYKRGDFPIAEQYYDQTITIPLYPSMSNEDMYRVVELILNFFKNHK